MPARAKIILDSIGPNGKRIITVEATYWRGIHAELMTHRDRARNAASSRAIPWKRKRKRMDHESEAEYAASMAEGGIDTLVKNCMFAMISSEPFVPKEFGLENPGMQTGKFLEGIDKEAATKVWLEARDLALQQADKLAALGVHKSLCNRLTEPFMWITTLITATEWNNFFRLRCHPMAEIHFQEMAGLIRDCIKNSIPQQLEAGEWHTPYIQQSDLETMSWEDKGREYDVQQIKLISAGRCARLSYLTHDGKRDQQDDIRLAGTLIKPPMDVDPDLMHASPFEHVCEANEDPNIRSGPMVGWLQMRKEYPNENVPGCPEPLA